MYDGSIVIGTELSTNKFDKQIADLDRKINKEEDKKINIETKLTNQEQELERARKKVDELADAYHNMKEAQERIKAGGRRPSEFAEDFATIQNLQAQYGTLEKIDSAFQKALDKQDALELKVQDTQNKYQAINNEISQYKQKIESINIQKQKAAVDQLKGSIDKVGSSFTGAVKKAGKLVLAIFSIRSAYMLLQRASSELSGYDEQYATNLEYIRFVLTQAIAPVLKYIVNLAMQLLGWINAILQACFGVNLFANGSVEAFQKMKKGASGVGKAVKEIKKQLLGFDEVNVLSSQSDTGTSAGAGGVSMPSFDVSNLKTVPEWLKKIIDVINKLKKYWKELLTVVGAFAAALGTIKLINFITDLLKLQNVTAKTKIGIASMVAGVVLLATSIINLILNWDKMTAKERVITAMLAVVGAAFIALGYAIATGISVATLGIGTIIAAIVALVATVVGLVAKLATEEKAIKKVQKAQEDLTSAKERAKQAEDSYIDAVDRSNETLKTLQEIEQKTKISGKELYKAVQEGTLDYKDMTATQKEVYKAYRDNEIAQEELIKQTGELKNAKKEETIATWEAKMATDAQADGFKDGSQKAIEFKNSVVQAWKEGKLSTEEAQEIISKSMTNMSTDAQQTFQEDIPADIKSGLEPRRYQTTWQKFRSDWDNFIKSLNNAVTITATVVVGGHTGAIGALVNLKKQLGFAKGGIIQLARGGIINQPGRGVPLGRAIGGEARQRTE